MLVTCQGPGQDLAPVDVIIMPGVPPIPTPVPDMAMHVTKPPSQFKVLYNTACFGQNMGSICVVTIDAPGVGAMSGTAMGPGQHTKGSMKVMLVGTPQTRWTDTTIQNAINAAGFTVSPDQFTTMVLT